MADAYIIDAVRSPMGRYGGGLSHLHPADLGANILSGLIERTGVDPAAVDDCIMGCVGQIGAQAFNVSPQRLAVSRAPRARPGGDHRPASADRHNRPCISPPRASCRVPKTWWWPGASRS